MNAKAVDFGLHHIGESSAPLADDSFGAGWAIEVDAGLGRLSLSFRPTSDGAALAVRAMSRYFDANASGRHTIQRRLRRQTTIVAQTSLVD